MQYKWQVVHREADDAFPSIWLFDLEEAARKRYGKIRLKPGQSKSLLRQPIPEWELVERKEV